MASVFSVAIGWISTIVIVDCSALVDCPFPGSLTGEGFSLLFFVCAISGVVNVSRIHYGIHEATSIMRYMRPKRKPRELTTVSFLGCRRSLGGFWVVCVLST